MLIRFFADTAILGPGDPEAYENGLFFGGGLDLLAEQVFSIVVVLAFSFVVTGVIAKVLDSTLGLRVEASVEADGLDRNEHAETGYGFAELGSMQRS